MWEKNKQLWLDVIKLKAQLLFYLFHPAKATRKPNQKRKTSLNHFHFDKLKEQIA